MAAHIEQAAVCLRCGDHHGAAGALQALELSEASHAFQIATGFLSRPHTTRDDVYVPFVAVKVLTYALTRCRGDRKQQGNAAVPLLLDYGHRMTSDAESHTWVPVVSALATAVAVALKLGCVSDVLEVQPAEVVAVWSGLVDLAQADAPSHRAALHRVLCQSAVEEFGLFSATSRFRGMPVRVHRRCRELFAAEGRLPILIQVLVRSLLTSANETAVSVEKGLAALVSCFAWPSHQFFEEDSSVEEACGVFYVAGPEWDRLLVGPMQRDDGALFTLHDVLREWYGNGAVGGVPASRQKILEIVQLLCAFKGSEWSEEQSLPFMAACLTLCLDVFEHLTTCAGESEHHLFPVLASATLRLVSNYVELFFFPPAHPLIVRLASLTCFLIRRDSSGGDDDPDALSCIDELLSVWFHLTLYIDRSSFSSNAAATRAQRHLISDGCREVFATYLSTKVSVNAVELQDDYFSDAFTSSHLHLVAQVGRINVQHTCELLLHSLQSMRGALTASLGQGAVPSSLFEALWTLMRVVGFFIADPIEGEQPYIPHCFLELGAQGSTLLLQLIAEVNLFSPLLQSPVAASSAVQAAHLDVLTNYIKTYVEAEETCPVYSTAFGEGAEVVRLAVQAVVGTLQTSPFEADATASAGRVLDCIAEKSGRVRGFCAAENAFQHLVQAAQQIHRFRFHGHTRGRIIAFLLTCTPETALLPARLRDFTLSPSPQDDVNVLLEILSSLAGLFESLRSQSVIRAVFPDLLAVGQQLLHISAAKFYEREIAVESVQFARSMFVTCSPLLEDSGIRALLELVVSALRNAVSALQTGTVWASAEGESDKADFIVIVAKLLSSVAQWKALDCFLPDEDVRSLATATVATAGELLRHMDERSLSLPSLEDGLFSCIEMCAESFTAEFAFAPCSAAFFSATLYALNSERVNIQRGGIFIATCVATFLESCTPQENHAAACADLLTVLLRALTSGKVFFNNLRPISRALLTLAQGVTYDQLLGILKGVSEEAPHSSGFLETVFPALQSAVGQNSLGDAQFEEVIQDALSSIRGTSIIGA